MRGDFMKHQIKICFLGLIFLLLSPLNAKQGVTTPFGLYLYFPGATPGDSADIAKVAKTVSDLNAKWQRGAISWKWIEPAQDSFNWTGGTNLRIMIAANFGLTYMPVFKINKCWANGFPGNPPGDTSYPPLDLQDTWDTLYGYSQNYYDFIYQTVNHYKDYLEYIVIENEANTPRFWKGTKEEYIKILKTAYKAAHDADANIKVANSGTASGAWGMLITRDKLETGQFTEEEALEFANSYYRRYTGGDEPMFDDFAELEDFLYSPSSDTVFDRVLYYLANYKGCIDVFNFHFYEDYWHLKDVVQWVKDKMREYGYSPPFFINNEYGIRNRDSTYDVIGKDQAFEVFKKLIIGLRDSLEILSWFSPKEDETDKVALIGEDTTWREAAYTFQLVAGKLSDRYKFDHSLLDDYPIQRYAFKDQLNQKVNLEAGWCDSIPQELKIPVPQACTSVVVIDYLGNECYLPIVNDSVTVEFSESPIFIEYLMKTGVEERQNGRGFLFQNYPNPCLCSTTIRYSVTEPAWVELKIYNVAGKRVKTLVDMQQEAGNYVIKWKGRDEINNPVVSGMYFIKLKVGKISQTKKQLLLR